MQPFASSSPELFPQALPVADIMGLLLCLHLYSISLNCWSRLFLLLVLALLPYSRSPAFPDALQKLLDGLEMGKLLNGILLHPLPSGGAPELTVLQEKESK